MSHPWPLFIFWSFLGEHFRYHCMTKIFQKADLNLLVNTASFLLIYLCFSTAYNEYVHYQILLMTSGIYRKRMFCQLSPNHWSGQLKSLSTLHLIIFYCCVFHFTSWNSTKMMANLASNQRLLAILGSITIWLTSCVTG